MENRPETALLIDLILDLKKDTNEIKKDLAEHMRRNEVSEARLDVQEEKLEAFMAEIKPIQDKALVMITMKKWGIAALKIIAAVLSIVGMILGLLKLR